MIAAVIAWAPLLKWQRSRLRGVASIALATAVPLWIGALHGWSLLGELGDAFALPLLLLTTAVGLTALFCLARPPFRGLLLTLVCIASFLSWGGLGLMRAFSDPPPVKVAALPDGYRYDIRIKGMAFTSDFVHTRVAHSPAWVPFVERTVITSWVKGPDAGLVGDQKALAATSIESPTGRQLLVVYEGETIDRLAY